VPSTIYEFRTTVSTYVPFRISFATTYDVTTAVSVLYVPQTTTTNTFTTTFVSISVSERTIGGDPGTGSGTGAGIGPRGGGTVTLTATPTNPDGVFTVTTGGSRGGVVTVTKGNGSGSATNETTTTTGFVTVAPSSRSTSSNFTCRTYSTNYLNGAVLTGVIKCRDKKRIIFDAEIVIGENDESKMPRLGALPQL
jgi:hypothetical protein